MTRSRIPITMKIHESSVAISPIPTKPGRAAIIPALKNTKACDSISISRSSLSSGCTSGASAMISVPAVHYQSSYQSKWKFRPIVIMCPLSRNCLSRMLDSLDSTFSSQMYR